LLVWVVLNAVGALPEVARIVELTWFVAALSHLNFYGFFAITMLGAIYYIVPQVTGVPWPWPRLVRAHFWFAAIGVILFALPLGIGGVVEGQKIANTEIAFMDVVRATLMFLRVSTIGDLLIAVGHLFLLANISALSIRYYRAHFVPAYAAATAVTEPAEVKS
jgi:cytochrome c oxidase cbb3-type subunit I